MRATEATAWGHAILEGSRAALTAIAANALRSALTALGIIIGVAAVIAVVAVMQGLSGTITRQLDDLASDMVIVNAHTPRKELLIGLRNTLSSEDFVALRDRLQGVQSITAVYLPLGLEGVDGLIAYLLLTDLAGGPQADAHHRLAVADGAFFVFEETPLSPKGAAILASRLTRRARRRIQNEILYCLLKREGVGAMPVTAVELHRLAKKRRLEPRRDPVNWWFDRIVLDEIAAS